VVCLNDVAPYNMVFDDARRLTGFIDVDTASPGPRAWDLAYLAYRLAPLSQFEDTGAGPPSLGYRRARLGLLCRTYAAAGDRVPVAPSDVLHTTISRLEDLAAFTAARAAAGATHVADHVQGYRSDTRWVREHLEALLPAG
jgi:aminoglycoside phosphotransferase (APT) family kinase protein